MDDPCGRLGKRRELTVGNDDGQLDDPLALRIKTGHFHVQPNEVIRILCHIIRLNLEKQYCVTDPWTTF